MEETLVPGVNYRHGNSEGRRQAVFKGKVEDKQQCGQYKENSHVDMKNVLLKAWKSVITG